MNRYQREVAEMDSRHRQVVRALSFAGAAGLAVLVLWSAGLPPTEWWAAVHRWWSHEAPAEPVVASVPSVAPPTTGAPATGADRKPLPAEGTDSSISQRPQPLYLVATTPGRNEHEGTARIGTSRNNPQTYVGGAILVNGARLTEIHADHVVLERAGKKLSLFLASDREGSHKTHAQASAELAMVPAMSRERSAVELLGVDSLGEVIRSMAYYENDVLQGLQVVPGRQAATFARLGLKPADVIVAIDAVAVTDAQNAREYLQGLTQGAAISVQVRRGSAIHTLSLDGTLIESSRSKTGTPAQPAPPDLARTFP